MEGRESEVLDDKSTFYFKTFTELLKTPENSSERANLLRRIAWLYPEERKFFIPKSGEIIDDEAGVNNFAGPTLALAEGRIKNRSHLWKSNLTGEEILSWIRNPKKPKAKEGPDPLTKLLSLPTKRDDEDIRNRRERSSSPLASLSCKVNDEPKFNFKPIGSSNALPKETPFTAVQPSRAQPKENSLMTSHFAKVQPKESPALTAQPARIQSKESPSMTAQPARVQSKESSFTTAHDKLITDMQQKYGQKSVQKRLGASRSSPMSNFKPPIPREEKFSTIREERPLSQESREAPMTEESLHPSYKGIDPKIIELITNEIMDHGTTVTWSDIAGLEFVKTMVKEIVVFPLLRPDIFSGLRGPPKGKTLIGKCIASQSKSTFFSISASSVTSKWVGEGEKMVRALFAVARVHQPSVVFIDEIDSLLTARSDNENESSRRIKTEFLVQLDGATTTGEERILIVGATNRPQDLDEAARRRLVKRLYVPLPEFEARRQIIVNLISSQAHSLTDEDVDHIAKIAEGYSGADMANLCKEAAMGPIRSLDYSKIEELSSSDVRHIQKSDFISALKQVKASVSDKDLNSYYEWNAKFGAGK